MKITSRLKLALKALLSVKFGEVETDKATLLWDGDEDLREGVEVFVRNEEDEIVPAEDGEYITTDGKTIVVVEGKVAEIRDPEAEVAPEAEEVEEVENTEVAEEVEEEVPAPADEPEVTEEEVSVEDRVAALEARIAEIVDGINAIVNGMAEMEGRIAEVEGKLAKVEAPAADPVDDGTEVEETKKSRLSYLRKDK